MILTPQLYEKHEQLFRTAPTYHLPLDNLTIFLHSPNGGHFPAARAGLGDCQCAV